MTHLLELKKKAADGCWGTKNPMGKTRNLLVETSKDSMRCQDVSRWVDMDVYPLELRRLIVGTGGIYIIENANRPEIPGSTNSNWLAKSS